MFYLIKFFTIGLSLPVKLLFGDNKIRAVINSSKSLVASNTFAVVVIVVVVVVILYV